MDGVHVTVMGLGRFGGGTGVARWLAERGARVTATDLQPEDQLPDARRDLSPWIDDGRIVLRAGGHLEADFVSADLVVVNPAVPKPWDNPFLRAARATGVPLTTEIGLLVNHLERGRVVGVTGSAGKSTTTSMIHHVLECTGHRAHLGGNIGGTLLDRLPGIGPDDWVVLELSSAMLYWLDQQSWSPYVAVMTNLRPNHLDWHGSFDHYRTSKEAIFRHQQPQDHAVRGEVEPAPPPIQLTLPGAHNQSNAWLAVTAAARLGVPAAEAIAALATFRGLEHRLELVGEHEGRRFYNDSKSTTPDATRVAVEALAADARVHLLAGGYDKKIDLSAIVELAPGLGGLYTVGATGAQLAAAVRDGHAEYCETLDTAASHALKRMRPGDVLLLSPGCASWDQFENYEARGAAFRSWVRAHGGRCD